MVIIRPVIATLQFIITLQCVGVWSEKFNAAVVEYTYNIEDTENLTQVFYNNVQEYIRIIQIYTDTWTSSDQKGIMVFPECGLTTERVDHPQLFVSVPEPDYMNSNFTGNYVLDKLSRGAQKYKIWLVVNLMEISGLYKYNTDVVFRSNGTIAARYRKYNLYGEPLDSTSKPEVKHFLTDFGITFGIFTCFDILFPHPALDLVNKGIKYFVYPTAWYSELPFLTAIQYQMSWAWANNVTLLASGLGYSNIGHTGTGIYQGTFGPLIYYQTSRTDSTRVFYTTLDSENQRYSQNTNYTKVEKRETSQTSDTQNQQHSTVDGGASVGETHKIVRDNRFLLKQEDLHAYKSILLEPHGCQLEQPLTENSSSILCSKNEKQKICSNGLCCKFEVTTKYEMCAATSECQAINGTQLDDFSLSAYRLVVLNGVRSYGVATGGIQTCALVSCRNESLSSCGLPPNTSYQSYVYIHGQPYSVLRRFVTAIEISGDFLLEEENVETFISPNLLLGHSSSNRTSDLFGYLTNISSFQVNRDDGRVVYKFGPYLNKSRPLGTAGIWSRVFNRDGRQVSSSDIPNITILLLLSIILIYDN